MRRAFVRAASVVTQAIQNSGGINNVSAVAVHPHTRHISGVSASKQTGMEAKPESSALSAASTGIWAPGLLRDKVAIVTGGGAGIGLACVKALAQVGSTVVAVDVDKQALKSVEQCNQGLQIHAVVGDVRDRAQVQDIVKRTAEQHGGLDILIANAGIVRTADFLDMSDGDFDDVIDTNLKGVFITCREAAAQMGQQTEALPVRGGSIIKTYSISAVVAIPNIGGYKTANGGTCQEAAKQMVKQNEQTPGRGGTIITMSSVNAAVAIPNIAGYNAAKGGVSSLTRCMSLALAPHDIRVNAIGPGSIQTRVLQAVANNEAAKHRILSRTPLGRIGDPDEIGQIAVFLASSASSYITGQTIYADGGRLALNYTCELKQ